MKGISGMANIDDKGGVKRRETVLALSAHADDAHTAIGGTLLRLLETGNYDIYYLAFSIAEESVPKGFPRNIVGKECRKGLIELGIDNKKIIIHRFPVRKFPTFRQDILEIMSKLRKDLEPAIVFMPSLQDFHQDHAVVCQEGIRAFRRTAMLLGYDFPWNVLYEQKLNYFVELKEWHVNKKIKSIQCYKSQIVKANNCLTPEYLKSLAIERGNRIGVKYAESMELMRSVWNL